jgi:hypothetical protein
MSAWYMQTLCSYANNFSFPNKKTPILPETTLEEFSRAKSARKLDSAIGSEKKQ